MSKRIPVSNSESDSESHDTARSNFSTKLSICDLEYKHDITSIFCNPIDHHFEHGLAQNGLRSTIKVKWNKQKLLRAFRKSKEILKNSNRKCYSFNRCLFDFLLTKKFHTPVYATEPFEHLEQKYDEALEKFNIIYKRQVDINKEWSKSLKNVLKIKSMQKETCGILEKSKSHLQFIKAKYTKFQSFVAMEQKFKNYSNNFLRPIISDKVSCVIMF